jgi:hypothetical protein
MSIINNPPLKKEIPSRKNGTIKFNPPLQFKGPLKFNPPSKIKVAPFIRSFVYIISLKKTPLIIKTGVKDHYVTAIKGKDNRDNGIKQRKFTINKRKNFIPPILPINAKCLIPQQFLKHKGYSYSKHYTIFRIKETPFTIIKAPSKLIRAINRRLKLLPGLPNTIPLNIKPNWEMIK